MPGIYLGKVSSDYFDKPEKPEKPDGDIYSQLREQGYYIPTYNNDLPYYANSLNEQYARYYLNNPKGQSSVTPATPTSPLDNLPDEFGFTNDVPDWQKTMSTLMGGGYLQAAMTALPAAAIGASLGSVVGPIGTIAGGLLGLGAGWSIPKLAEPQKWEELRKNYGDAAWIDVLQGATNTAFWGLNVLSEKTEQGIGTAAQMGEALLEGMDREVPNIYWSARDGDWVEFAESWFKMAEPVHELLKHVPETFEASKLTYEVLEAQLPAGLKASNIPAGIEYILDRKPSQYPGLGGDFKIPESDVVFAHAGEVHVLGEAKPVIVDVYGLAALNAIRGELLTTNEAPSDILAKYQEMYGFSGQFADLVYQTLADPLNVIPAVETGAVKLYAGMTGDKILSLACDTAFKEMGGVATVSRAYKSYARTSMSIAEARKLPKLNKRLAGLDPEGFPVDSPSSLTYDPNIFKLTMNKLTGKTRAQMAVNWTAEGASAMLSGINNVDDMVKLINKWADVDHKEVKMAAEIFNTPEMVSLKPGIQEARKFINNKYYADYLRAGEDGSRAILQEIATLSDEKVIDVIKKIEDGFIDDVVQGIDAGKASDALRPLMRDEKGFKGKLEAMGKEANKKLHAYDEHHFKYTIMDELNKSMQDFTVKAYNLKSDSELMKFTRSLKGIQSLILLAHNPNYLINNVVNNAVQMATEGVFNLTSMKEIAGLFSDLDINPIYYSGTAATDTVSVSKMPEGVSYGKINAAMRSEGLGQKALDTTQKLQALGFVQKASATLEAKMGAQTYYSYFKKAYNTMWNTDTMPQMSDLLINALDELDPKLANYMYASAMKAGKLDDLLALMNGPNEKIYNTVEPYYSRLVQDYNMDIKAIMDVLDETGFAKRLNTKLASGMDIVKAAHEVQMEVLENIAKDWGVNLKKRAKEIGELQNAKDVQAIANKIQELKAAGKTLADLDNRSLPEEWNKTRIKNAVNADRNVLKQELYKKIDDVPIDEAINAMNKRIGEAPVTPEAKPQNYSTLEQYIEADRLIKPDKNDYVIAYHNTDIDKVNDIAKYGLKTDSGVANVGETWLTIEPGEGYGGNTIIVQIPKEFMDRYKVNNTELLIPHDIPPEDILYIDKAVATGLGKGTKYNDIVIQLAEHIQNNKIDRNSFEQLIDSYPEDFFVTKEEALQIYDAADKYVNEYNQAQAETKPQPSLETQAEHTTNMVSMGGMTKALEIFQDMQLFLDEFGMRHFDDLSRQFELIDQTVNTVQRQLMWDNFNERMRAEYTMVKAVMENTYDGVLKGMKADGTVAKQLLDTYKKLNDSWDGYYKKKDKLFQKAFKDLEKVSYGSDEAKKIWNNAQVSASNLYNAHANVEVTSHTKMGDLLVDLMSKQFGDSYAAIVKKWWDNLGQLSQERVSMMESLRAWERGDIESITNDKIRKFLEDNNAIQEGTTPAARREIWEKYIKEIYAPHANEVSSRSMDFAKEINEAIEGNIDPTTIDTSGVEEAKMRTLEHNMEAGTDIANSVDDGLAMGPQRPGFATEVSQPVDIPMLRYDSFVNMSRPLIDSLVKYMSTDIPIGKEGLNLDRLSPVAKRELQKWIGKLKQEQPKAKLAAMRHGEIGREFTLLNYDKRYNFDDTLSAVFPYQFWYTRTLSNWATRFMDRPALLSSMMRLANMREENENIPSRLKGKFRIPNILGEEWTGKDIYVDPWSKLYPMAQFARPFEQWDREKVMINKEAKNILYDMLDKGEITQAEYDAALASEEDVLWQKIYREAEADVGNGVMSYINLISNPALYLTIPYNIITGKEDYGGPFPGSRLIQSLATATGIEGLRKLDIESHIRQNMGLSEFGEWGDYYIDRELSNMAADGLIDSRTAIIAMSEREGEAYDQALERVRYAQMIRTPGMTLIDSFNRLIRGDEDKNNLLGAVAFGWMPADILPEGELRQRGLYNIYSDARKDYNNGNKEAFDEFFAKYPEYQSRLALFDKPKERFRNFMVNEIWDKYWELDKIERAAVFDEFGEVFEMQFVNKATQDYDSIDTDTLLEWSRRMGGYAGKDVPQQQDLNINPMARIYAEERDRLFPLYKEAEAYYFQDDDKQARWNRLQETPWLKDYWDWKKEFLTEHPDVAPYVTTDEKAFEYMMGEEYIEEFGLPNTKNWEPGLLSHVFNYGTYGDQLNAGAKAMLRYYYNQSGAAKTGISFNEWISMAVDEVK